MALANVLSYFRQNKGVNLGHNIMLSSLSLTSSETINTFPIIVPEDGYLESVQIVCAGTLEADDSRYFTLKVLNKSLSDLEMSANIDANTTKLTGGSGITSWITRDVILSSAKSNLEVRKSQCLAFQTIRSGSTIQVDGVSVLFKFQ